MAYDIIITGLIDRHGVWHHTGLLRQAWRMTSYRADRQSYRADRQAWRMTYRADRQAWRMASYRAAKTGMAYGIIQG